MKSNTSIMSSQDIDELEEDESVVYQKEVRVFSIECNIPPGENLILPICVQLDQKIPLSSKCFFRLRKTIHSKGEGFHRLKTKWNPNHIKFDFKEDTKFNNSTQFKSRTSMDQEFDSPMVASQNSNLLRVVRSRKKQRRS